MYAESVKMLSFSAEIKTETEIRSTFTLPWPHHTTFPLATCASSAGDDKRYRLQLVAVALVHRLIAASRL